MALDDQRDDGGHVGLGIDAVELAGFDQRGDDGQWPAPPSEPANRAFFRVSASEHGPLDGVVVDFDAAVAGEADKALPA